MDRLPGPVKPLTLEFSKPIKAGHKVGYQVPQKLRPRLRLVFQLIETGLPPKDIAKMTGYSYNRVIQLANIKHPRFEALRAEIRRKVTDNIVDVSAKFKALADEALKRQVELMRQQDDKPTARLASKFILEVSGHSPVRKQINASIQVPTQEFIDAVQRMDKSDEVEERAHEWAFQPPVKEVPPPAAPKQLEASNDSPQGQGWVQSFSQAWGKGSQQEGEKQKGSSGSASRG